jgi:site-specific DNA-methyltransferase (adenine-specific)/adenine-specific DNA-methyltransferase
MPTLDWIGKKAVLNHDREVPFHLLRCDGKLSLGDSDAGNLLVQGDNLVALKALLPFYAGQVKCIYIDPPYNTGNENWIYNDAVNSPEIREWLGQTVGREAEDLSRHDKWLCMMYPRLVVLRDFLRDDGAIFVSIDDNEVQNLRALMDEVFGPRNFVATAIWQKRYSASNDSTGIPAMHDYILIYRRTDKFSRNLLPRTQKQDKAYKNPDNDPRGPWKAADFTCNKTRSERPNLFYALEQPTSHREVWPKETRVWGYEREVYQQYAKDNRLWWGKRGTNSVPSLKKFLNEVQDGIVPVTWWPHTEVGHTDEAKKEVLEILTTLPGYMTPKPVALIERIIRISSGPADLILDSFAGTGTTAHAVMRLNEQDGGRRRFILIEMDEEICRTVTAKRVSKVIEGYIPYELGKNKPVPGLGGGFRFCTLGETLFDKNGRLCREVSFKDLARHIFFAETGEPQPSATSGKRSALIGTCNGTAYFLLFNGILGDQRPEGGNVLTGEVLGRLPRHGGPRIVFGEGCRLGAARLKREGVAFKQIPYEIKVS